MNVAWSVCTVIPYPYWIYSVQRDSIYNIRFSWKSQLLFLVFILFNFIRKFILFKKLFTYEIMKLFPQFLLNCNLFLCANTLKYQPSRNPWISNILFPQLIIYQMQTYLPEFHTQQYVNKRHLSTLLYFPFLEDVHTTMSYDLISPPPFYQTAPFPCSNRKYVTYFESVIWKCSLKYCDTYFSERWNCSPNSFNDISPVKLCCMYEIISFSTVFLPLLSFSIINPFSHMWRINCKRIIFVFIWTAISNFFSSFFAIYISANC